MYTFYAMSVLIVRTRTAAKQSSSVERTVMRQVRGNVHVPPQLLMWASSGMGLSQAHCKAVKPVHFQNRMLTRWTSFMPKVVKGCALGRWASSTQETQLTEAPRLLVLHLKRFAWTSRAPLSGLSGHGFEALRVKGTEYPWSCMARPRC